MRVILVGNKPDDIFLDNLEAEIAEVRKTGMCSDIDSLEQGALKLRGLNIDKPRQLNLMLEAARACYSNGKPEYGLKIAEYAGEFATELSDLVSKSLSLSLQGIFLADMGNLGSAIETYAEALTLAQKNADWRSEAKIWHNLAAALTYAGLYREGIACSLRTHELFKKYDATDFVGINAAANVAICSLYLDDIEQGINIVQTVLRFDHQLKNTHELHCLCLCENYFTRLLIENKDYIGAEEHAKKAREYATLSQSPRSEIAASIAEGLVDIFMGRDEVGITRLTRALAHAKSRNIVSREAQAALIKAYEHLGQHDKALEHLQQMLAVQRKTQEENVLRQVQRHLEQLHASTDHAPIEDPQKAIKQLETRQEVFEGRIAKRDIAVARSDVHAAKQEVSVARHDAELAKLEFFRLSIQSLARVAVTAEMRDDSSGEHSYRVGRLSSLLALEAGCDEAMVFMIEIAAGLNDIGKIAIPDGILLKPGFLNSSERQIMEIHAEAGADMLAKSNIPHIQMAEEIARYHHERWDGQGYPAGLIADAIPLAARITAIADVFDAMTHKRPYRGALPIDAALIEILSQRGKQFDPVLTDHFVALISRLQRENHQAGNTLDSLLGEAAKTSSFNQAKEKIWDSLKLNSVR
jgi:putative two-component system response regulator